MVLVSRHPDRTTVQATSVPDPVLGCTGFDRTMRAGGRRFALIGTILSEAVAIEVMARQVFDVPCATSGTTRCARVEDALGRSRGLVLPPKKGDTYVALGRCACRP